MSTSLNMINNEQRQKNATAGGRGGPDEDLRTGSSHTVCQIPELVVNQVPSGFKRCLPSAMLVESAQEETKDSQRCQAIMDKEMRQLMPLRNHSGSLWQTGNPRSGKALAVN